MSLKLRRYKAQGHHHTDPTEAGDVEELPQGGVSQSEKQRVQECGCQGQGRSPGVGWKPGRLFPEVRPCVPST